MLKIKPARLIACSSQEQPQSIGGWMRVFLLISILSMSVCGCAGIYDSRNQNYLNINKPEYSGAAAKDAKLKTGRLIAWSLLMKVPSVGEIGK